MFSRPQEMHVQLNRILPATDWFWYAISCMALEGPTIAWKLTFLDQYDIIEPFLRETETYLFDKESHPKLYELYDELYDMGRYNVGPDDYISDQATLDKLRETGAVEKPYPIHEATKVFEIQRFLTQLALLLKLEKAKEPELLGGKAWSTGYFLNYQQRKLPVYLDLNPDFNDAAEILWRKHLSDRRREFVLLTSHLWNYRDGKFEPTFTLLNPEQDSGTMTAEASLELLTPIADNEAKLLLGASHVHLFSLADIIHVDAAGRSLERVRESLSDFLDERLKPIGRERLQVNEFRKRPGQNKWTIGLAGGEAIEVDNKHAGLHVIAALLKQPGKKIGALELAGSLPVRPKYLPDEATLSAAIAGESEEDDDEQPQAGQSNNTSDLNKEPDAEEYGLVSMVYKERLEQKEKAIREGNQKLLEEAIDGIAHLTDKKPAIVKRIEKEIAQHLRVPSSLAIPGWPALS